MLPFDALAEADLARNTDTGLNAKTRAASLGECDAFVRPRLDHGTCGPPLTMVSDP